MLGCSCQQHTSAAVHQLESVMTSVCAYSRRLLFVRDRPRLLPNLLKRGTFALPSCAFATDIASCEHRIPLCLRK